MWPAVPQLARATGRRTRKAIKQRVCTVRISLFRKLDRRLEPPPGRARHELAAPIKAAPTESVPGAECLVGASSPASINGLEPQGVEAILSTECQVGLNRKLTGAPWAHYMLLQRVSIVRTNTVAKFYPDDIDKGI